MDENCNKESANSASSCENQSLTEHKDVDIYDTVPMKYQESGSHCDAILSDSCDFISPHLGQSDNGSIGSLPLIDSNKVYVNPLHLVDSHNDNIASLPQVDSYNGNVSSLSLIDLSSTYGNTQSETVNQTEENIYSLPCNDQQQPYLIHSLKHSHSESACSDISTIQKTNSDYYYKSSDYHTSKDSLSLEPLLDNDFTSIQSENLYDTVNAQSKETSGRPTEKINVNSRKRIFHKKKLSKKWNLFRKSDPLSFSTPMSEEVEDKKHNVKFQIQKSTPSPNPATIGSSDLPCDGTYSLANSQFSQESDVSWPSDEFDCSDDLNSDSDDDEYPNKPLPPIPKKQPYRFADSEVALALFNKIRSTGTKNFSDNEEECICFPVTLKTDKFEPPHLPPPPEGLTCKQIKKRCVLECIISSEKSYIESLQRIQQDYETPILEAVDLQKSKVKSSLQKLREILNYHHMFQIELANRVNDWREENIIGDIFIASFSKSMVLDAYSVYVNNFTAIMEDIKKLQRTRQSFRDFLKQKETSSPDRLSIFALMVKPIQRFPQFILCLQDLLKYTPKGHGDRKALQLAVTILENLAQKLNDRKRENEKKFAAKQLSMKIPDGLTKIPSFHTSFLVREDDVLHITNNYTKKRRLIMLNNALVCIKVQYRMRDGDISEHYKHKWTVPLEEVTLKFNCSMSSKNIPPFTPTGEASKINRIDKTVKDIYEEINAMDHDYNIWSQIHNLASSLKLTYDVLNEDLINGILGDLQRQIQVQNEQVQLLNSCIIEFEIPDKSGKVREVYQTLTPIIKQHWCLDLAIAKLALSPLNQPGWDVPVLHNTDQLTESPSAFYVSSLPIDVSTNMSQLQCAVGVYLQSFIGFHIGIPHIWVCSNIAESGGQVSIVSVQRGCSTVSLNESFQATDAAITCVERVEGDRRPEDCNMAVDTVWMATVTCKMYIYGLQTCKSKQRQPIQVFDLPGHVLHLLYAGEKVFAAMDNGCVLIFERNTDGYHSWCVDAPQIIELSSDPIVCLLKITSDDCILAASGNMIHKIDYHTGQLQDSCCLSPTDVIQHIVQAGVGIWVSYQNSPTIHLYHIENLNLLQDINISSAGARVFPADGLKECTVTCLLASLGMLWIGTNVGLLLSFPLPRLRNGVPIVSGRPYVSYHGHKETVRFILPFMVGYRTKHDTVALSSQNNSQTLSTSSKCRTLKPSGANIGLQHDSHGINNNDDEEKEYYDDDEEYYDDDETLVEDKYKAFERELKAKLSKRYDSTPVLHNKGGTEEVEALYGSLMCDVTPRARTQSLYHHRLSRLRRSGGQQGKIISCYNTYNSNNSNTLKATSGNTFDFPTLTPQMPLTSVKYHRKNSKTKCQDSDKDELTVPTTSSRSNNTSTSMTTTSIITTAVAVEKEIVTLIKQNSLQEAYESQIPETNGANSQTTLTTTANTTTTTTSTISSSTLTPTSQSSSPSLLSSSTTTASNNFSSLQARMSQNPRIWEYQEASDCNSIMIISGGNGYFNASSNTMANKSSKGNDATLLFWIYKI